MTIALVLQSNTAAQLKLQHYTYKLKKTKYTRTNITNHRNEYAVDIIIIIIIIIIFFNNKLTSATSTQYMDSEQYNRYTIEVQHVQLNAINILES